MATTANVPEKLGAVEGHFGTVNAFEFNLLDHEGRIRARLGTNEGGEPGFALFAPGTDETLNLRAEVILTADGPQLRLYHVGTAGSRGCIGAVVKVDDTGSAVVTLQNHQGKPRAFLLLPADETVSASGGTVDRRGRFARFSSALPPTPSELAEALEPLVRAGKRRAFDRTAAGLLGVADRDALDDLWQKARARLTKRAPRARRNAA